MKLSEFKNHIESLEELRFFDIHGQQVPAHFHLTELGLIRRHSIDCGKSIHQSTQACMQLWVANDYEHRLTPDGMHKIIKLSESVIGTEDHDIEIEYQTETIGRYDLVFINGAFHLKPKHTDCLAKEKCGIPEVPKKKLQMADIGKSEACCTPGGGCC